VDIESTAGGIDTNGFFINTAAVSGAGGAITLKAVNTISTASLESSSNSGVSGDISVTSTSGNIFANGGNTDSSSVSGSAGKITFEALGTESSITTGNLDAKVSSGTGSGGEISLTAGRGDITTGYIRSDSAGGLGGNIKLDAQPQLGGDGGLVSVTDIINIQGADFSIFAGINENPNNNEGPKIEIRHRGIYSNPDDVFTVGDSSINGTEGAIMSGRYAIVDTLAIEEPYKLGGINFVTTLQIANAPLEKMIKDNLELVFVSQFPVPLSQNFKQKLDILQKSKALSITAAIDDLKYQSPDDKIKVAGSVFSGSSVLFDIKRILESANKYGVTDKAQIAYIIATASWESTFGIIGLSGYPERNPTNPAQLIYTYNPMFEYAGYPPGGIYYVTGSSAEQAYFNNYYANNNGNGNANSGDGYRYRGRGYVQLTGKSNYQRLGTDFSVDLIDDLADPNDNNDPDKVATNRQLAADILVRGMKEGLFTGVGFSSGPQGTISVSKNNPNFINARKIINSLVEASSIETMANKYLNTLNKI
jgi:predicted chitinase